MHRKFDDGGVSSTKHLYDCTVVREEQRRWRHYDLLYDCTVGILKDDDCNAHVLAPSWRWTDLALTNKPARIKRQHIKTTQEYSLFTWLKLPLHVHVKNNDSQFPYIPNSHDLNYWPDLQRLLSTRTPVTTRRRARSLRLGLHVTKAQRKSGSQ